MRITVWLVTRERDTWIVGAEILALALVLLLAAPPVLRLGVGLPVLAHVGYRALTSLPIGCIPTRPSGAPKRRNLTLRSRVVAFLNEVREAEAVAQHARRVPAARVGVERELEAAARRMMAAAAEVVKATGSPA